MKTERDVFSEILFYPGKGQLYIRMDSKIFRFGSSKEKSLFLQRKNPRKIAWTAVYRRVNRKGITEEVAKKRSRKSVKHQRGVAGLSMEQILARRTQKPEARAAARQAALTAGKEKKKAAEAKKAQGKPAGAKTAQPKMAKSQMKAGGKR